MIPFERALTEKAQESERQHRHCTDCGNPLKREEMVQGRCPSYVRPIVGAPRQRFYGLDEKPRDPLCRMCWKKAVAELR